MRKSYRLERGAWDMVLAASRVVLVCPCSPSDPTCHRNILARLLRKGGARVYGEITEWDVTGEPLHDTTPF